MEFEWDEPKAARNLVKHGVAFQETATVFGDPLALTKPRIISARQITRKERKFYEEG